MSRGPYKRISLTDRQRIVRAFQEGRDFMSLADDLEIKRQTARSIIISYRRNGVIEPQPKVGRVFLKVYDEMKSAVIRYVENKPAITLKEICERTAQEFSEKPIVSRQTISNILDGAFFSIKNGKCSYTMEFSRSKVIEKTFYGMDEGHRIPASSSIHR